MNRAAKQVTGPSADPTVTPFNDDLIYGIWPKSFPLWSAAIYWTFFIIRPWEHLVPWLALIRCEKALALLMIGITVLSTKRQFKRNALNLSTLGFLGALSLSALFAWKPVMAWDAVYIYVTYIIFFFILTNVVRTTYELLFMIAVYITAMGLYLGKSQWEYFIHDAGTFDMGVHRMWGIDITFAYPNNVAQSTVLTLPFFVLLWNHRKVFSSRWRPFLRRLFSWALIAYFPLAVSSVFLTNSRIGMLGLTAFGLLTAFRVKKIGKKLKNLIIVILLMFITWQFVPIEKKNRLRTLWDPSAGPSSAVKSAEGRQEGFEAGIAMFKKFPVLGVGIGCYVPYRVKKVDGVDLTPHNMVGQLLGETGIIGALAFLVMVSTILVNTHRQKKWADANPTKHSLIISDLGRAISTAIVLLLFMGISSHNLLRPQWLWYAAFAVVGSALQAPRKHEPFRRR